MRIGPAEAPDPILQRLRTLVRESPDLKGAARLYETVLPLLRDADLHAGPVSLTSEQVRAKMEAGLPLLYGLDLEFDSRAAHELALRLTHSLEAMMKKKRARGSWLPWIGAPDEGYGRARRLRLALEEETLEIGALLGHAAAGEKARIATAAETLGLDPDLLWMLVLNVLKPALRAWNRQLAPLADTSRWQKDYCFVCGCRAALGELQENNQAKHLRCGQCGADWPSHRLRCARCGNEDHRTLGYLCTEGAGERTRVEVCEKCHGYIKVIASFAPAPPEMLEIEDLATIHLDYIAQERGYSRDTAVEAATSSLRP